jgi:hypothetical protein
LGIDIVLEDERKEAWILDSSSKIERILFSLLSREPIRTPPNQKKMHMTKATMNCQAQLFGSFWDFSYS